MTIGYDTGEWKTIVANVIGDDNVGALVNTWLLLSLNQLGMRNPNVFRKIHVNKAIVATENTIYTYPTLSTAPHIFGIAAVNLLDASDIQDDAGWLRRTTLERIWMAEDQSRIASEIRRPWFWAPAGVVLEDFDAQTGDDGKLGFRIYPQPTGGAYSTRKIRVTYYEFPLKADASDATIDVEGSLAKKAVFEGLMRYVYLYVGDVPGYLIARAEQRKALSRLRTSFGSIAGRKTAVAGGRQ
jgi:hypothetical protein